MGFIEIGVALAANLLAIGMFAGWIRASLQNIDREIRRLEEKQEKHNGLMERLAVTEKESSAAHGRIDRLAERHEALERDVLAGRGS